MALYKLRMKCHARWRYPTGSGRHHGRYHQNYSEWFDIRLDSCTASLATALGDEPGCDTDRVGHGIGTSHVKERT